METERSIDNAQIAVAETHDMTTAFEFLKTNRFARQGLADEQVLALPFDLSGWTDAPYLVVVRISARATMKKMLNWLRN